MKQSIRIFALSKKKIVYSLFPLFFLLIYFNGQAQNLNGYWQGIEFNPDGYISEFWPSLLTIDTDTSSNLFQSAAEETNVFALYKMKLKKVPQKNIVILGHESVLKEGNGNYDGDWCFGKIILKYNSAKEMLTGTSFYETDGCQTGKIELHRLLLTSKDLFCPNEDILLRVTGKKVKWYADPHKKQLLNKGNIYRPDQSISDTFYVTQTYLKTETPVAPIIINVKKAAVKGLELSNETIKVISSDSSLKFKLDKGSYQSSSVFSNVNMSQNHQVTVLDSESCTFSFSTIDYLSPLFPNGVNLNDKIILKELFFEENKSEILATSYSTIEELASYMKRQPLLKIRLEGHTDYGDNFDENITLSIKRANAVKEALLKKGINSERITTKGLGFTKLLYRSPNKGNRRVELIITSK